MSGFPAVTAGHSAGLTAAASVYQPATRRSQIQVVTPPPGPQSEPAALVPAPFAATLTVPAIGLHRQVVDHFEDPLVLSQQAIDRCAGAVGFGGAPDLGYWLLGAHRTACGSQGFAGVESLPVGTAAHIDYRGRRFSYVLERIDVVPNGTPNEWDGSRLILQTSKTTTTVYFARFTLVE